MEFDKIIEIIRKIIRSEGSKQDKLVKIWEFLESVEKGERYLR